MKNPDQTSLDRPDIDRRPDADLPRDLGAVCAHCRGVVARWWLADHSACPCCGFAFAEAAP